MQELLEEDDQEVDVIQTIKPSDIKPTNHNPRKDFGTAALEELAKSIQELGLLQPPTVYAMKKSPHSKKMEYIIVCGERRVKACQMLGLDEIPRIVVDAPATRQEAIQMALVENLQREDLSIDEEAPAIVELIEGGMKRAAVAKALGKSPAYIGTRYSLAKHPEVLEAYVKQGTALETFATIGQINDDKVRARVLKDASDFRYLETSTVRAVKKLERLPAGALDRQLSVFCCEYHNARNGVERCCVERYCREEGDCEHFVEVNYRVARWLGLKKEGYSTAYVCADPDQTCYDYKRNQETKVREKLQKLDSKRLIDRDSRWIDGKNVQVDMFDLVKSCKKCKSLYQVPEAFQHHRDVGLSYPWLYCTAADPACFDAKKKKFLAEKKKLVKKSPSTGSSLPRREDLELLSDEDLKALVVETLRQDEQEDSRLSWRAENMVEVMVGRGFVPEVKIDVEWSEFKAPGECSAGCFFHPERDSYINVGCPEKCPHREDGEPKPKEGEAA